MSSSQPTVSSGCATGAPGDAGATGATAGAGATGAGAAAAGAGAYGARGTAGNGAAALASTSAAACDDVSAIGVAAGSVGSPIAPRAVGGSTTADSRIGAPARFGVRRSAGAA